MLNILAAVLLFGFIVLVHEFGHFLLAKCSGIGVVEFSVGMGPRIFSVEKGETRYSIKALPFGGSCMMVGEDAENPDPKAFKPHQGAVVRAVRAGFAAAGRQHHRT